MIDPNTDLSNKRLICLDTETTGLETRDGHRVIEIGAVEIINRTITNSEFQVYIQPNKLVGDSVAIHGITDDFLGDKPLFENVYQDFIDYVKGSVLIIHNAAFDVGFLNHEFGLMGLKTSIEDSCEVVDTIEISKKINPRAQHSLNALARKHNIDLSNRDLHGALLDAQILAQVYIAMTGGQRTLFANQQNSDDKQDNKHLKKQPIDSNRDPITIIKASKAEQLAHQTYWD